MSNYRIANWRAHNANNLDAIKDLADNSIDSIVTDPPYEIAFMGRDWDNSGQAYNEQLWRECLRVLKPGGHLIAFGATRTIHQTTSAIEDAGFEIRDMISWLYFSGFPKSLDIGKAIDKNRHTIDQVLTVTRWLNKQVKNANVSNKEILQHFGFNAGSGSVGHWTALNTGSQPSVPALDQVTKLLNFLKVTEIPDEIAILIFDMNSNKNEPAKSWFDREITGTYNQGSPASTWMANNGFKADTSAKKRRDNAATPEAQQWAGYGTALKPAQEPAILARKPIEAGSIAKQVLATGTGAINIDGCRFSYGDPCWVGNTEDETDNKLGRWPANIYQCAKPSRAERDAGLEHLDGDIKNVHPTVKPIKLMRWLCRLITPPSGTVLDPFAGSGTTLAAAILEGFDVIGFELTAEYMPIIEGRCKWAIEEYKRENAQLSMLDWMEASK